MQGLNNCILKFLVTSILIIGGLSWGILGMTGYNPISRFAQALGLPFLTRVIYTIVGLASILYLYKWVNAKSLVPHYGETLLPSALLNIGHVPVNFNRTASLNAPPGALYLAYWSDDVSEPRTFPDKEYQNWGVSYVNDGKAEIRIKSKDGEDSAPVFYRWVGQSRIGAVNTATL